MGRLDRLLMAIITCARLLLLTSAALWVHRMGTHAATGQTERTTIGAALTSASRRETPANHCSCALTNVGHTRLARTSLVDVTGHAYCELLQRQVIPERWTC